MDFDDYKSSHHYILINEDKEKEVKKEEDNKEEEKNENESNDDKNIEIIEAEDENDN